jgi:protein-S-isoprenylcysteine O-methyltransferase Ste14
MSGWRQARAVALLPGNVTVLIPALILLLVDAPDVGWGLGGASAVLVALLGLVLIGAGFALWLWTVRLFQRLGKGTLAPWDPTAELVVAGPYRHVRNPMITAVGTLLIGEAIFFGSPWILAWALLFLAVNALWFPLGEEPGLERRFGAEYRAYKQAVPRWIPRRSPWRAS